MNASIPDQNERRKPKVAILLAAGYGKRQRPLTDRTPKPLLMVKGRPLIRYALEALACGGIRNIEVVTHHLEQQIITYLRHYQHQALDFEFSHQQAVSGTADAVRSVSGHFKAIIKRTDFVIITATDYLFPEHYIRDLIDFHVKGTQHISVSLRKIDREEAKLSSIVVMDADAKIEKIIEKPNFTITGDTMAATLLYIVPVRIFDFLNRIAISSRGEYELQAVINKMIASGYTAAGLLQSSSIAW